MGMISLPQSLRRITILHEDTARCLFIPNTVANPNLTTMTRTESVVLRISPNLPSEKDQRENTRNDNSTNRNLKHGATLEGKKVWMDLSRDKDISLLFKLCYKVNNFIIGGFFL